ncbi:MAG: glycosyltransferase family 4 protein [Candidatus Sericytochromatia bacterium]
MRIAIIGKKYPFCGIVTYCRELIRALRAQGHTVAFYYLHNEEVHEENEDGLPYLLRTHVYIVPQGDAKQRLAEQLRQFKPDVVHASFALSFLDFALPDICDALGVPLVVTFHAAYDRRPSLHNRLSGMVYRMYARTLARADRVIIFSEPQRRRLATLGVDSRRVTVLPNGVDAQRYRPGGSTFKSEIRARRLLAYMGRIDPEKNVGPMLKIVTGLELPKDVHLAVMGDGVLANKLKPRYADHPQIHWLGFVEDEERRIDVLRGADIFVLPSTIEGLSLALLEAMACGAAPIATDVGADAEVIQGCGTIIDPGRLDEQLGPAVLAMLEDDRRLAALQAGARRRVVSRYAMRRNIDRLLEVYEEARRPTWRLAR